MYTGSLGPLKKDKYRREGKKVVAAAWGTALLHQDDLKKRINRITATWQNGSHHTNNHRTRMDVLITTFLYIILAFPSVFILLLCL